MERLFYYKSVKHFREYKGKGLLDRLNTKKKIGILLLFISICIIGYIVSSIFLLTNGNTDILPVPNSVIYQYINSINKNNDNNLGIEKYLSTNKSYKSNISSYTLNFPSLNVSGIKVTTNVPLIPSVYENKLESSTVQYQGTAQIGTTGNTFVYGHSSPVWFHSLFPSSYEGIFTSLFSLKVGDPITANVNNQTFSYIIESIYTIKQTDFSQINSIPSESTLTLMTCSPPGVDNMRLIVRAVKVD